MRPKVSMTLWLLPTLDFAVESSVDPWRAGVPEPSEAPLNHIPRPSAVSFGAAVLLWAISSLVQPADAATVRGRVVDAQSRDPIYRATIVLLGTDQRASSDHDGRFQFDDLPAGTYSLRASRLGFEDATADDMRLEEGDVREVELAMTRGAVPLEEVTVTPGTFSFMDTGTSSRQTMSREEIESVSQLGEDLFRAVNRLPGLSSGDYSAHFSIRGGRHDETLILLDGLQLYEPYHLKDFNEGAISIVDAETVEGVQLMTGGFSARYGDKRSGVFDITSRSIELDKSHASVGISLINGRASGRGPLWGGKGAWLLSGRSGYLDLIFSIIKQNQLPSPRYQDVFGKLQLDLSPNHSLTFDVLYAGDKYKFDAGSTSGFLDSIQTREYANNHYSNSYVWTTLNSTLGQHTFVRTMVSAGYVTRDRDGDERVQPTQVPFYTITNNRDLTILNAQQDWTMGFADMYVLTAGVDWRYLYTKDNYKSLIYQDPNDPTPDSTGTYPVTTLTSYKAEGSRTGVYLSNRLRFVDPLVIDLGYRYDGASYTGDHDFSPRVSAALSIGGGRTLRAGWGYYRQIQSIDDVFVLNGNSSYSNSELSKQWTVGLEQQFSRGAFVRLEGFTKRGSFLRPTYRNWKGGIDTFPETNEDRILVYPVSNWIRGIELFADRRFGERMAGRASYSYSVGDETVDRIENVNAEFPLVFDRTHPIPQDQRHAVNADFTYKFRKKWSATGSLVWHTGWPGTLEELVPVVDSGGEIDYTIHPQKLYGVRLPDYLRFDIRATRRWNTKRGEVRFFAEIINLTNHANVFGYDYFKTLDANGNIVLAREEETWFSIFPSLGIAWTGTF